MVLSANKKVYSFLCANARVKCACLCSFEKVMLPEMMCFSTFQNPPRDKLQGIFHSCEIPANWKINEYHRSAKPLEVFLIAL